MSVLAMRRTGSAHQQYHAAREKRLSEFGAVHCPDCNAELLSRNAIGTHKARGTCVQIPGVRARAADALVEHLRALGVIA
jgi:hypothetical protein